MSKRFSKGSHSSPAKRLKLDLTVESVTPKEKKLHQNDKSKVAQINDNDIWGDDFGEEEIEEMDFIASQATQEEVIFIQPKPRIESISKSTRSSSLDAVPSTSSGERGKFQNNNAFDTGIQSQMLGSSDINKEIIESTQAIMFDDFENEIKSNSVNSTFCSKQNALSNNVVFVSDDDQIVKLKKEKKKLLEDFMTKEGETEFLRQQLNQIQARAENAKKEQARLMEEQTQKFRAEINALVKEKTSLESQLQLKNLEFNSMSEKCKLLESGTVKFAQPQVNMVKHNKDRSGSPMNWSYKKVKTKESSVQVENTSCVELLKTTVIQYPLQILPECTFQSPASEKSVIDIKIEEKIGKRNLAIIQDEETYRIFENPELSKPKVTIVDDENLSTKFFLPDLAKLVNKTSNEIISFDTIPILNKIVATTRELLLNSTLVLQNISKALQNDDIRDMNEIYLSEFYEMPVPHTKSFCEAHAWYDLERGIETRRAVGVMSYVASVSRYLADYVAGNIKLKLNEDLKYKTYASQMNSYQSWFRKGFDFEFLELILEFVVVVGTIRRSHQFTGLINAIVTLIANVQINVGFSLLGLRRVCSILKEIIYSRPLLACFITISNTLKEFSQCSSLVNKLCICPDKSGINYWKGSLSFTLDACALEIFITQLEHFKLDPITLINITKDLAAFSNTVLLNNSIPWLEKTVNSCNCCLNLLKFVIINLCKCSEINIDNLKNKYVEANISWRISKLEVNGKKNTITWKEELFEDWTTFENDQKHNFWDTLKTSQLSAIAYGIRLLSFLAKRDLDFMIRLTFIEDAFHLFLNNLRQREDLRLKESDEIALDIVKKTFVLEKSKEENKNYQHQLDVMKLVDEVDQSWTDFPSVSPDLIKLYEMEDIK